MVSRRRSSGRPATSPPGVQQPDRPGDGNGNTPAPAGATTAPHLDRRPGIFWTTRSGPVRPARRATGPRTSTEVIPVKANEVRWQMTTGGTMAYATGPRGSRRRPDRGGPRHFSRWTPASYESRLPAAGAANTRISVRQTAPAHLYLSIPAGATWTATATTAAAPSFILSEFQGHRMSWSPAAAPCPRGSPSSPPDRGHRHARGHRLRPTW